jgi:glutamyl-tRNA reductase
MRIGVIGINHKLADLKLREALAKACRRRFSTEHCLEQTHAFVLLSTCNRTEVYFSSADLPHMHSYLLSVLRCEIEDEFDQKLYSYFGYDCFQHLTRVTAGLDSAIIAETEIQGQVKSAYETAIKAFDLPNELHYLFQKSLKIGKMVRSRLPIKPGLPGLEHSIVNEASSYFLNPLDSKILCVGASDINKKVISFLKNKRFSDITLCNRTRCRGEEMGASLNVPLLDWSRVCDWHYYDWIVLGTKSSEYLITPQGVPTEISRKLIIDLSVPRNADPAISCHPRINLFNIDQLNHSLEIRHKKMADDITHAESLAVEATKQQIFLFQQKETHRLRLSYASA